MDEVRTKDRQGRLIHEASEREARDLLEELRAPLGMPTQTYAETAKVAIGEMKQLAPVDAAVLAMLQPPQTYHRGRILGVAHVADTTNTITLRVAHPDGRINGAVELVLGKRNVAVCIATEVNNYVAIIGHANGSLLDDVEDGWPWEGSDVWPLNWEDVSLSCGAPPSGLGANGGRWRHLMVYDSGRDKHCLFGGKDPLNVLQNDWWEIDGQSGLWANPAPVGPPTAREYYAMDYDSIGQRMLVFGGNDAGGARNDLLSCDGANWAVIIAHGAGGNPSARWGMAGFFDPYYSTAGAFWIFGGHGYDNQLWRCDLSGPTWANVTPATSPAGRNWSMFGYDPVRRRALLIGGWPGSGQWELDPALVTWTEFTGEELPFGGGTARWWVLPYSIPHKRIMDIAAAPGSGSSRRMGAYLYDPDDEEWDIPPLKPETWNANQESAGSHNCNLPAARYNHGFSWDNTRRRGYLFGGDNAYQPVGFYGWTWRLSL